MNKFYCERDPTDPFGILIRIATTHLPPEADQLGELQRRAHVFYGGDIREVELPWLRKQVESMAALSPADDDGDFPVGMFVISDERAAVSVWEVRDGVVCERAAPELSWVFRE